MWAILFFMASRLSCAALVSFDHACRCGVRMQKRPLLIIGACKLKNTRVRSLFIWLLRLYVWSRTNANNMRTVAVARIHRSTRPDKCTLYIYWIQRGRPKGGERGKWKVEAFCRKNIVSRLRYLHKIGWQCCCRRRRRHHVFIIFIFSHHCVSAMCTRTLRGDAIPKSLKEFSFAWIASTMARKAIKYLNAAT